MGEASDDEWRRRFAQFALVRLGAVAIMMFGIAVALTNLLRPGGWPFVGGLIAVIAITIALIMPRILRRRWDRQ